MKRVTITIPKIMYNTLKLASVVRKKTMSKLIEQVLDIISKPEKLRWLAKELEDREIENGEHKIKVRGRG